jgi:hypothetical protein
MISHPRGWMKDAAYLHLRKILWSVCLYILSFQGLKKNKERREMSLKIFIKKKTRSQVDFYYVYCKQYNNVYSRIEMVHYK